MKTRAFESSASANSATPASIRANQFHPWYVGCKAGRVSSPCSAIRGEIGSGSRFGSGFTLPGPKFVHSSPAVSTASTLLGGTRILVLTATTTLTAPTTTAPPGPHSIIREQTVPTYMVSTAPTWLGGTRIVAVTITASWSRPHPPSPNRQRFF